MVASAVVRSMAVLLDRLGCESKIRGRGAPRLRRGVSERWGVWGTVEAPHEINPARALHEEVEDARAQTEVLGIVDQLGPRAGPRNLYLHDLGQPGLGAARHEGDAVGEQDRLVHVV